MPNCLCRSIAPPGRGFHPTKECGKRAVHFSGMFCIECKNEAIRLLNPSNDELTPQQKAMLQVKYGKHLEVYNAKQQPQKKKDNKTFMTKENRQATTQKQSAKMMKKRAAVTKAKREGDKGTLITLMENDPGLQKKRKTAIARGMSPAFSVVDYLADGRIHLLAGVATDVPMELSEGLIHYGCMMAETLSLARMMIDYRDLANEMMRYCAREGYDCNAVPKISGKVRFQNRDETHTKSELLLQQGCSTDDNETIKYAMETAKQGNSLRKAVQAWYKANINKKCGVKAHKDDMYDVPYAPKEFVRAKTVELIEELSLLTILLKILDDENPNEETEHCLLSILNGSFFFTSVSSTTFPFVKEMVEFGFPLSHAQPYRFNWELWKDLINRAVAKGYDRIGVLARFLLIWTGLDGSVFKEYFEVIAPNDEEILKLFCRIFKELLMGHGYSLNEYLQKSEVEGGKDIVHFHLTTGRQSSAAS